jgi:type I restriction enzyme S subunit
MKMLTPKAGAPVEFRYVYFAMQAIRYRPRNHARQWIGTYSAFKIPLPPTEVQREIVAILDDLARLEEELRASLTAESEARQLQHAHYRAGILGRSATQDDVVLSDLVEFINGKAHERLVVPDGSVALLTARFISTAGRMARWVDASDALTPALVGDIAMVMSDLPNGRALARCFYVEESGKYTANQRVCLLRVRDPTTLSSRWLYHFLERNPQLLAYDNGQDQTHLKKGQILNIKVPLIPLDGQERAVVSLDRLDAATPELTASIEAERAARRTQYEYYRDKLLTFEEAVA